MVSLACDRIGSRNGINGELSQSRWGSFALQAIEYINMALSNAYLALRATAVRTTLLNLNANDFFPRDGQTFNASLGHGMGLIMTLMSGFLPPLSTPFGVSGDVGIIFGDEAENQIADDINSVEGDQEDLSSIGGRTLGSVLNSYVNLTSVLLRGGIIQNASIFTMLYGGAWVSPSNIPDSSHIDEALGVELISRAINLLWKTPTSNKMWVLYVDLQDDQSTQARCLQDQSGPQMMKFCADGGVYYGYNFIETGNHKGNVGWPWGADSTHLGFQASVSSLDISMALLECAPNKVAKNIVEASARTYVFSKKNSLDPFNFDAGSATVKFLTNLGSGVAALDLRNAAGKLPGSWTLPVCNASTWGKNWNWDYTAREDGGSHPPCLCGNRSASKSRSSKC